MTAMPPEPDLSPQTRPRRSASRRMNGLRITTAVMWSAITVICAAGAVAELLIGVYGGAAVCLVVAVGAGRYAYRVWKRRARRLLL
jgi:hypothetical protein